MRIFLLKHAFMLLLFVIPFCVLPMQCNAAETEPTGTLPVIYINTENGKAVEHRSVYINAEMKIELNEETDEFANIYTGDFGSIEIRGRGNSTWGMPKKPYHIRLGVKTSLFGMSESRHWILLANALDGTHLRNTLSYNLSGDLGLYSIKTIHVELVFNGQYAGLYQLTESIKIASDRIDITDWEQLAEKTASAIAQREKFNNEQTEQLILSMQNDLDWITSGIYDIYNISDYYDISAYDITGGYLIELDEYYDEVSKFVSDNDVPIMIKEPEYLNTNQTMFGYIKKFISDMENALFSEDGYNDNEKHYTEYLDMDSFIDYWIVNQAFKSVEILYKSAFMYKDAGGLLVFGPVWDMDWSSGNHVNLYASSATYNEWQHSESQDREYWYRALYDDPFFIVSLQDRWFQVGDVIKKHIASIDTWYEELKTAAAANNDVWGEMNGWDFYKECTALETWMFNRLNWMNEQLSLHDPDIMQMGIRQSQNIKLSLIGYGGYELGADTNAGIKNTDVYYNGSGTIQANTAIADNEIKTLDVYINGIKKDVLNVSDGKASFKINTTGLYLTSDGRRNVILTIGRDSEGLIKGKSYITLSVSGHSMRNLIYSSSIENIGLTPKTISYAVGTVCNLPLATFAREGFEFIGWTDGVKNYSAGDEYIIRKGESDILFTALWQQSGVKNNSGNAFSVVYFLPVGAVVIILSTGFYMLYKKRLKKRKIINQ